MSAVPDAVIKAAENVWLAAGWIKRPDGAWSHPKAHNPPPHKPGDLPPIALVDFHNPRITAALWEFFKVACNQRAAEPEKPPAKSPADILREKIEARAAALEERIAAVAAIAASAAATQAKLGIYGVAHRELVEECRAKLRGEIAGLLQDIAGGTIALAEGGKDGD